MKVHCLSLLYQEKSLHKVDYLIPLDYPNRIVTYFIHLYPLIVFVDDCSVFLFLCNTWGINIRYFGWLIYKTSLVIWT